MSEQDIAIIISQIASFKSEIISQVDKRLERFEDYHEKMATERAEGLIANNLVIANSVKSALSDGFKRIQEMRDNCVDRKILYETLDKRVEEVEYGIKKTEGLKNKTLYTIFWLSLLGGLTVAWEFIKGIFKTKITTG